MIVTVVFLLFFSVSRAHEPDLPVIAVDPGSAHLRVARLRLAAQQRFYEHVLTRDGARWLASAVAFGPNNRFLGVARGGQGVNRSLLGRVNASVALGESGRSSRPEVVPAMLFQVAARLAQEAVSPPLSRSWSILLIVPWDAAEEELLGWAAAVKMAGLNVLGFVRDIEAVAVAYAVEHVVGMTEEKRVVAFVDIGASLARVAIVEFGPESLRVLAAKSDARISGRECDKVLRSLVDPEATDTQVQKSKHVLSVNRDDKTLRVTREAFEEGLLPMLNMLDQLALDALKEAGVDGVASLEVVGGSTRIPAVRETLAKRFEQPVSFHVKPSEGALFGAAYVAAARSNYPIPTISGFVEPVGVAVQGEAALSADEWIHATEELAWWEEVDRAETKAAEARNQLEAFLFATKQELHDIGDGDDGSITDANAWVDPNSEALATLRSLMDETMDWLDVQDTLTAGAEPFVLRLTDVTSARRDALNTYIEFQAHKKALAMLEKALREVPENARNWSDALREAASVHTKQEAWAARVRQAMVDSVQKRQAGIQVPRDIDWSDFEPPSDLAKHAVTVEKEVVRWNDHVRVRAARIKRQREQEERWWIVKAVEQMFKWTRRSGRRMWRAVTLNNVAISLVTSVALVGACWAVPFDALNRVWGGKPQHQGQRLGGTGQRKKY